VDAESNGIGYRSSCGDDEEGCPGKEIADITLKRTVGMQDNGINS
jgi:hypothetical protein